MTARLKKDIVIKKGAIFETAPIKTERYGGTHVEYIVGLDRDTAGSLIFSVDESDKGIGQWFEIL